jgi:protoporphyrinogen oxidase
MAALGATERLRAAGEEFLVFDKNPYHGGHTASFRHRSGFLFDDGPHVSFTRDERVRRILDGYVGGRQHTVAAHINNYWQGRWIAHPVQMNLHSLPHDLIVRILVDFVARQTADPPDDVGTYADWLVASYGPTFARTFPEVYGRKYHTTGPENMTTDWLGPRMYRPDLEEILRGALGEPGPNVHYVTEFRYPQEGGFVSYLSPFVRMPELRLRHDVVEINPAERVVCFANGHVQAYRALISSLPLPALVPLLRDVPARVSAAARLLSSTIAVIVNLGIDRDDLSEAHISYFYDEDIVFARLNFPHLLAPANVPPGAGSIQAEIYFSERYRPLEGQPARLIPRVIADLRRSGVLRREDQVIFREARIVPFANVIYDLERATALREVQGHVQEVGVHSCGRYGEWDHAWTDEAFVSGERAADAVLNA